MSTLTPKLALLKAAQAGEVVDVKAHITDAFDKIDAAASTFVCTSTTRPAAPYDGQLIKETDTKAFGIWDASSASWYMFDTVYQNYTPTVFFLGNGANSAVGNGTFSGQYFRRGKVMDLGVCLFKGSTTDWGSVVGTLLIRNPPGITLANNNVWGAFAAIDGMYSSNGKVYTANTGVQNMCCALQYGGDPNAMYFQTTAGSATVGVMLNQTILGTQTVGVGAGSYLSLSASGIKIQ